jgi:uncharacterized Zn finger protein
LFSEGVMERLCRQDTGLFPRPSEIRFTCSCADYASMCKHIAAVLYGVGARLDERPELLFRLRAVDETDLLSDLGSALPDTRTARDTAQTLVADDLAALFGLDMEESKAPALSHSADATSAGPRKKTHKSVGSDQPGHRPAAMTSTTARSAQATRKNPTAPTRTAAKKAVAAPTKSPEKSATAKPSAEIRKAQAKASVSARRRSDPIPGIAAAVPVSRIPSRRPVRSSAAPRLAGNAKRRRRAGDG